MSDIADVVNGVRLIALASRTDPEAARELRKAKHRHSWHYPFYLVYDPRRDCRICHVHQRLVVTGSRRRSWRTISAEE